MKSLATTQRIRGENLVFTVVLIGSAREGVTGKTDADFLAAYWNPTAGATAFASPDLVVTELDATNAPGWYQIDVAASVIDDSEELFAIYLGPVVSGDFDQVQVFGTNLNRWWVGYNEDFDALQSRIDRIDTLTTGGS